MEKRDIKIDNNDNLEQIARKMHLSYSAAYSRIYRAYKSGKIQIDSERINQYRNQLYYLERETELKNKKRYYQDNRKQILAKMKKNYNDCIEKRRKSARERYRNSANKEEKIRKNSQRKKKKRILLREFSKIIEARNLELRLNGVSKKGDYIIIYIEDERYKRDLQNHFILSARSRNLSHLYDPSCTLYSSGKVLLRLLDSPWERDERERFISDYFYFLREINKKPRVS